MSVYVMPQPLPYFVSINGNRSPHTEAPSPPGTLRGFALEAPPTDGAVDGGSGVNLGVEFYVTAAATLTHIHWWQPTTNAETSQRNVRLYTLAGTPVIAAAVSDTPAGPGWQSVPIPSPPSLTANTRYMAVVWHPHAGYVASANYFTGLADIVNSVLVIPGAPNATNNEQGTFFYDTAIGMTTDAFNSTNYWTDVTVVVS